MTQTIAKPKPTATAPLTSPTARGLSICIPVFNEQGAIRETLSRCLALGDALRQCGVEAFEVIAVDDGSTDRTPELIEEMPAVRLIRHGRNRGYGAALKTGFAAARYDLIGFLDADATYPPECFPDLCRRVREDGADLVVGSRMAGAETEMPLVRRLGNTLFAKLLTLIGQTPVSDSASGMRVFTREALQILSPLPDGLNLTPVMSTRAVHEGISLVEVPIPYRERVGPSKLSVARDGVRFLTTMVSSALAYNPVRIFGALGLAGILASALILAALMVVRLQGVTELGPLGTFAMFVALVCGVAGVTVFALGATFNYLVSLFYNRPIRQGLFRRPILTRPIEDMFLPAGMVAGAIGAALSVGSLSLALQGWPMERLWLYLTVSAMSILMGIQLMSWWLMASVLARLSRQFVGPSPAAEAADHV